jgi:hypothetical protein
MSGNETRRTNIFDYPTSKMEDFIMPILQTLCSILLFALQEDTTPSPVSDSERRKRQPAGPFLWVILALCAAVTIIAAYVIHKSL